MAPTVRLPHCDALEGNHKAALSLERYCCARDGAPPAITQALILSCKTFLACPLSSARRIGGAKHNPAMLQSKAMSALNWSKAVRWINREPKRFLRSGSSLTSC